MSEGLLGDAQARIADAVLGSGAPERLGQIRLRPHQQIAVARVSRALERFGGCLLADDVGRGKTYVALALVRTWTRPLVVVPASLRTTWLRAMEQAGVSAPLVTHEALSRGAAPEIEPDGVVVDESHRFRSLVAKRHAALAHVAAHARVLLLSATPLQNGARDLAAQVALFLGSAALRASDSSLARHVIRAPARDDTDLPKVAAPKWLQPQQDDAAVLRAILALPPPARAFDVGDAGALRTIGLVRAWASSRAALSAALRQRRRMATAIEQCATMGLIPARRDLRAWHSVSNDVQLAFAPLLVRHGAGASASALLAAVARERCALDTLSATLCATSDPDRARVAALRTVRAAHPGRRILAFSEFASTVRAYYALLRAEPEVGMLTASEARIASGRLPRDALLARFAPATHGTREPSARERVSLLLATDLLSEGVNLQDASVVVHLDLPWNPARLAQRVGRVRRPGGSSLVHSFLMAPPAPSELLLRVDARLRAKLARAERTIGLTLPTLPALAPAAAPHGEVVAPATMDVASAEALGRVADVIARWRHERTQRPEIGTRAPVVAAVEARRAGWLAALDDGRLLATRGEAIVNRGDLLLWAVGTCEGLPRAVTEGERLRALRDVESWLARRRVALDCGVNDAVSALDPILERRIALSLRRAPRHAQARLLDVATRLRAALGQPRSLGAERELEMLLACGGRGPEGDIEWLDRALAVVARRDVRRGAEQHARVVAMIIFGPAPDDALSAGTGLATG